MEFRFFGLLASKGRDQEIIAAVEQATWKVVSLGKINPGRARSYANYAEVSSESGQVQVWRNHYHLPYAI